MLSSQVATLIQIRDSLEALLQNLTALSTDSSISLLSNLINSSTQLGVSSHQDQSSQQQLLSQQGEILRQLQENNTNNTQGNNMSFPNNNCIIFPSFPFLAYLPLPNLSQFNSHLDIFTTNDRISSISNNNIIGGVVGGIRIGSNDRPLKKLEINQIPTVIYKKNKIKKNICKHDITNHNSNNNNNTELYEVGNSEDKSFVKIQKKTISKDNNNNKINTPQQDTPDGPTTNFTCAVCLDDYKSRQKLRVLPCHHRFHVRCLDKWLKKKSNCPICKYTIL